MSKKANPTMVGMFVIALAVVLGIMIWRQWPFSGQWAIGILVGVRLVMAGWSLIALGAVGEGLADEVDSLEAATAEGTSDKRL